MKRLALALLLGAAAVACAPRPAPQRPADLPRSLPRAKQAIVEYHESGRWAQDCRAAARALLDHAAAAMKAEKPGKPAVVMDLEDTLLSTYALRRDNGFCASQEDLQQWRLLEMLPPVPSTPDLAAELQNRGVRVFVISRRPEQLRLPTLENLAHAGFAPDNLYLLPPGDADLAYAEFKDKVRTMLAGQGFTILASLDDHPDEAGEVHAGRVFLIPNLMY